jgi:hypothetical protein
MRHLITVIILFISIPLFAQVNGGSNIHYDVEFDRICLVDSIAPDTIIQFWRYTHANNPGSLVRDVTFDLSGAYNVQGTVISCKDYYANNTGSAVTPISTLELSTYEDSLIVNSSKTPVIRIPAYDRTGMQQWWTALGDTSNNRVKNILFWGDSNTEFFPDAFTIPLRDHLTAVLGDAGYGWMNARTDRQDHVDLIDYGTWYSAATTAAGLYALDGFDRTWYADSLDGLEYEFTPSSLLAGPDAAKSSARCNVVEFHYYGYDNSTQVRYEITNETAATSADTFTVSAGYNVQRVELPEWGYHDALFQAISGDSLRFMGMNFTTPDSLGRQGVKVHRIGHSGWTWGDYLYLNDTIFKQQIENLNTDLIIFQLGGNGFVEADADSLINKVRSVNDTIGIALLTPQVNAANDQTAAKIRDRKYWYLSKKYDTGFASLFQLHGDRVIGDSLGVYTAVGSAHFNPAGGRMNGRFIGQDLLAIPSKSTFLEAGTNISFTGSGTPADPLQVNSTASGAMAIGSAVSGGDEGAVLFVDASGNLDQDTTKIYFDSVNGKLGINTGQNVKGDFEVTGNVGSDIGNDVVLFGDNNATSATTLERLMMSGKGNFPLATSLNYDLVTGFDNGINATGSHIYNQITGLRQLQNASGSTANTINGLENFKASTGQVRWSGASGEDNFLNGTGAHTYNWATGFSNYQNAWGSYLYAHGRSNFGSYSGALNWCTAIGQECFLSLNAGNGDNNIGIGLEVFEDITQGSGNIGLGKRAAEGMTDTNVSDAIVIGTEAAENHTGASVDGDIFIGAGAGRNDNNSNTILIGEDVLATADNQIVIGDASSGHTELRSRNVAFDIDQSLSGLNGAQMRYDETADQFQAVLPALGEMFITAADPDTISITASTPAEGTDWTAGILQDFTYSAGRLTYTGADTIHVSVHASVSFSHSVNSSTIFGWVYQNGSQVTKSGFERLIGNGGDIGNAGSTCLLQLVQNDYIELFFDSSDTGSMIIKYANVRLHRI